MVPAAPAVSPGGGLIARIKARTSGEWTDVGGVAAAWVEHDGGLSQPLGDAVRTAAVPAGAGVVTNMRRPPRTC